MPDVVAVLIWWVLLQAMGLVALPLVFRLLRWLPDRGYSVAKPAGLLLGNYVLWLLGTLGWLRNTEGGILLAFGLVALFGVWVYRRWDDGPRLIDWLRAHKNWIIAYEAVFLAALVFWSIYRAHNPDLFSTEKPMEFAFMNAIRRSPAFPPPDPWLSGFAISYYYFGYVMMATLTQLSGVASGVAFSLTNAMWFALTAAGAFGIVANLVAASQPATRNAIVGAGLLGALFVPVLGNFQGTLEVAHTNDIGPSSVWRLLGKETIDADWMPAPLRDNAQFWRWLDVQEINVPPRPLEPGEVRWPFCGGCSHPRGQWWFWRASRVVHDYPVGSDRSNPAEYEEAIDEFPFFSFILGDNHPHVLALPYALMSLALAFNLFRMNASQQVEGTSAKGWRDWRAWFWEAAPIGLAYPIFLGGLSFLNTWDFPIHVLIAVVAWGLGRWLTNRRKLGEVAGDGFIALVACGLLGVVAYLPFYIGFRSQLQGIVPNIFYPTRFQQFFVMFGPFILIGLVFVVAQLLRARRERGWSAGRPTKRWGLFRMAVNVLGGGGGVMVGAAILTAVASFLVLAVSAGVRAKLDEWSGALADRGISVSQAAIERLGEFATPLFLGILMAAVVLILRARRASVDDRPEPAEQESAAPFAVMLFGFGALLAFAVEYVYLLDFFGYRINTIFKLYYQTWALWGVAAAYAVYHLMHSRERLTTAAARTAFAALLAVCISGAMVYPLLALQSGTAPTSQPTLDARAPTIQSSPDQAAAIEWLERNAPLRAVVLESAGDSYQEHTARVSAWTGVPGVLGWEYHEGQWRGTYNDIAPRRPDIDRIYETTDPVVAMELLKKYGVTYVYVGPNETSRYSPDGLAKFNAIMDVAFQQGSATIYRRRDVQAGGAVGLN